MPEMREVYSSSVGEIGYDEETGLLHVRWAKGGKTSVYGPMPAQEADEVMRAPSVGQALREVVQGVYEHRYL